MSRRRKAGAVHRTSGESHDATVGARTRATCIAHLAAVLLLAGCKLIALGDSNTCIKFYETPCAEDTWPGMLQSRVWWRGWRVINRGMPGMTAGRLYDGVGNDIRTGTDEYAFAAFHVEQALNEEHLARACRWLIVPAFAPVVVLALGTNDIPTHDGDTVAADILALAARIETVAPCVRVFIGLIPPCGRTKGAAEIVRANAALRARVPPDRLIDLYTGFGPADLAEDGVHLTYEGHEKRAEVVRRAVWARR